jgi:AraC-like DNA-binding protein
MNAPAPTANAKKELRQDIRKAGVTFCFFEPRPELKPYVRQICAIESPTGFPSSDRSIAAPNGCPKLIFPYDNSVTSVVEQQVFESEERSLYFMGVRDKPAIVRTSSRRTGCLGVEFYPYGAYSLFKMPMNETINSLLDINVFLPKWGREITQTLESLNTVAERVSFIQDRLVALIREDQVDNRIITFCVDSLKGSDGLMTVSDLAQKSNYSRRYLEILFRDQVGLSPKALADIFRFQKFYRMWASGRSYDEIKDELYQHYHDQAHFTKEFRRMTGFSPHYFAHEVSNEFGRQLTTH